ncbi:hypothetical protein EY668_14450, partial [Enterococcus faecalis]|nr:hypothetical protein [Enterococcus faecalis]
LDYLAHHYTQKHPLAEQEGVRLSNSKD